MEGEVAQARPCFQSAMESHTDEVNLEHVGLESPEDFQFDPDCTLILYGLHGRNTKGLLKKFLRIGTVTFWQPVLQYDTAIVAYATPELALEAKNSISDEKILFCTVREPFFARALCGLDLHFPSPGFILTADLSLACF